MWCPHVKLTCDAVPQTPNRVHVQGDQAEPSCSISGKDILPYVECVVPVDVHTAVPWLYSLKVSALFGEIPKL